MIKIVLQVSMIVHKIENTLLIDKFDIHKQLICPINNTHGWDWLKKFFDDNIAKSFDRKVSQFFTILY